jgi:hypothetical protein
MEPNESSRSLALTLAYSLALRQPDLTTSLAVERLVTPEAGEVLRGSLDTLWRNILTPDSEGAPPPLDVSQKSWLLVHAGLLRGFNLAIITCWRESGDTLPDLNRLYPGFLEYGEALHTTALRDVDRLAATPGEDQRRIVERVAAESRALLDLGLRRGYGLGFLVDLALQVPLLKNGGLEHLMDALRDAVTVRALSDDSSVAEVAARWSAPLTRVDRHRVLDDLGANAQARGRFQAMMAEASLNRPLVVPAAISRYSPAFVRTMLAYLIGWWFATGLAEPGTGEPRPPARAVTIWRQFPIRRWVEAQALAWAREEDAELLALAADPTALRWRLAELAQVSAALGWTLHEHLRPASPEP